MKKKGEKPHELMQINNSGTPIIRDIYVITWRVRSNGKQLQRLVLVRKRVRGETT